MGRSLNINGNHIDSFPRHNDVLSEILHRNSKIHDKDWESDEFEDLFTQHDLVKMIKELGKELEEKFVKTHEHVNDEEINERIEEIMENKKFNWYTLREYYEDCGKYLCLDEDTSINEYMCFRLIVTLIERIGFDKTEIKEDENILDVAYEDHDADMTIVQLVGPIYVNDEDILTTIKAIAMALNDLSVIEDENSAKSFFAENFAEYGCGWIMYSENLLEDYEKQVASDGQMKRMHDMYQEKKKDYFTEILAMQQKYKPIYEEFKEKCMNKRVSTIYYG